MYKTITIKAGDGGWGGPLTITATEKCHKILSVTGGGIHPVAQKIAMPMSTCLRNARGRRTDTTATATSAAPFANVHSSRMKESCVSYRGNRCTFSDQLLNVSNANARPCANENKPAFGGATPSPFCSRDLNMPVL